jgi:iron complex transport system ATP-binding protein
VGYVPQRFGGDQLVVFDAVLLGRKPHIRWVASDRDFRVVERVLALMGLEALALRPVSELSGGEAQKVALARALAQEPRILLLDEPVSNLDLKNQMEVMSLVTQAVKTDGLSAMIAIHDLNLALRFADRFLMVKAGTIHDVVDRDGITPGMIEDVYDIRTIIRDVEGYPVVIPVPECCVSHEPLPAAVSGSGVLSGHRGRV